MVSILKVIIHGYHSDNKGEWAGRHNKNIMNFDGFKAS